MAPRVLHLCSEKGWRGGEQQVIYLVEELRKLGVENVLALRAESILQQRCEAMGFPSHLVPFSNSLDFISARKVKEICRAERIDLIHTHTSVAHGVAVLSALLGNTVPIVVSRRVDFIPKDNFLSRWKYNYPRIKRIVGVSQRITEIMSRYVRRPEQCVTIYSGVDIERFAAHPPVNTLRTAFGIHPIRKLIGNTSALAGHKDYYTFIDTIEKINALNCPAAGFIIGEGPEEERLKAYALRRGVQHLIVFTGFRKDIQALLPCLDLFLMTSNEEGLGTSLLDAFLARVPVVATRAGGIPEIVRHNETGRLAPIGDSNALAREVVGLLENDLERQTIVEAAYRLARSFSKAHTAEQTLSVYREILDGK